MSHVDPKAGPRVVEKRETRETTASEIHSSEAGETGEKESIADKAKNLLRTHLLPGKKISFSSKGKSEAPQPLPAASRGRFPLKTAEGWKMFFSNVLRLGSLEKTVTRDSLALVEALFRGTYRESPSSPKAVLVSDLRFSGDGTEVLKFARIPLPSGQTASLEKLNPGDLVKRESLPLAEKLEFVQIVHQPPIETPKDPTVLLTLLKNPSNPELLARFEKILLEERTRRGSKSASWVPMGPLPEEKEKKPGKPRSWTLFIYAITFITASIVLYAFIRALSNY